MAYAEQKLQIDMTGRKGLADKFYGDINNFGTSGDQSLGTPQYRITGKSGEVVSGIFNPIRKYGFLSPSVGTIYEYSNNATDISLVGAARYDALANKIYYLTNITGTANPPGLQRIDGIDSTTLNVDRTMPASTTFGGSLEIYTVYDGTSANRCLFYSYLSSSGWRVGTKQLDNNTSGSGINTFTDNWLGSGGAVTGTFQMPFTGECKFVLAGDGYMYILNGNEVHRVDGTQLGGTSGTVTKDVLLAPTFNRFTHGVDLNGNLYLALQKTTASESHNGSLTTDDILTRNFVSDCGVYVWNRQASFTNSSSYIPILGVREIRALWVEPRRNNLMCITIASNGVTQLRQFDGNLFRIVKELGFGAYPNYSDSLTTAGSFSVWLGYDGNIYYYGAEGIDIKETAYGTVESENNFFFVMGTVQVSGLQTVFGGAILYAGSSGFSTSNTERYLECLNLSYTISGNAKLSKFFPNANSPLTGGVTTTMNASTVPIIYPIAQLPKLSTITNITIFMARENGLTPGTTDAVIKFYKNGDTSSFMQKNVLTDDINKGYVSYEINTPFVDWLQIAVVYTGSPMSNKRFNPAYAVVSYMPTATLK